TCQPIAAEPLQRFSPVLQPIRHLLSRRKCPIHPTYISKLRSANRPARTLHFRRVQQLSTGGNLVESAERIGRLVEGFRAADFPCGLLGLPRLARSVVEEIVFRPPTRLRQAM